MTIQDKISQLLPSFLKRYDGNKDSVNEGTIERYQKMLASEIDAFFLESTDNLHENTKAVTMPTKFLPYEEDLRGTSKMVFEFPPPPPTLNEIDLIFDFDFEQTAKMALNNQSLVYYDDRGLQLAQYNPNSCPELTTEGIYFDGVDDFMAMSADFVEMWIVCNNTSGNVMGGGAIAPQGLLQCDNGVFLIGGINDTKINTDTNLVTVFKCNNIQVQNGYIEFSPLATYKSICLKQNTQSSFFYLGAINGIYLWEGNIKRILLFSSARTETQRTELQAYLALKYSL